MCCLSSVAVLLTVCISCSRVHKLNVADGSEMWVSEILDGACSGTPVISGDDGYVFVTHSADMSGTFSVLDGTGQTFYQESDTTLPLSPPGIYFNPTDGNYAGGEGNSNDIIIWGNTPFAGQDGVSTNSSSYAFQFPVGFQGADMGLKVVKLLDDTNFQTTTPPLITNSGQSMFWGVSRSKVNGWQPNTSFDRNVGGNSIGFDRGSPFSLPVIAEIAVGAGLDSPTLYTGSAGSQFGAVTTIGGSLISKWTVTMTSMVYAQAHVAPTAVDEVVYVIEENGTVHALDAETGAEKWNFAATPGSVLSNFAQSKGGEAIYFADTNGLLYAFQVAEAAPTMVPVVPTSPPVIAATLAPVIAPTVAAPTVAPTTTVPTTLTPTGTTLLPVIDVINGNPLTTLLPQMLSTLNATGISDITVFAPYDTAFTTAFEATYLSSLMEDPLWIKHLECLVFEHGVPAFLDTSAMWVDGQEVENLNSEKLTLGTSPVPSVNGVDIDSVDNVAVDGVVHFVEVAILPDCVEFDIFELGMDNPDFSTLISLVEGAGLKNAIKTEMPMTLFAPTNEAFEKVPTEVLDYLTTNRTALQEVLFYHLVRTNIYLEDSDGSGAGTYPSTSGAMDTLTVEFDSGEFTFTVNNVTISDENILASNGIIQVIDEVLLPPNFVLPSSSGAPVAAAPVTAAPVTPVPETAAPVTSPPTAVGETLAPVTPVPETAAPVTAAPVTAAPKTTAPVTAAPVTSGPTPAPVTPVPTPEITPTPVAATPAPSAMPTSSAATTGISALIVTIFVGFWM